MRFTRSQAAKIKELSVNLASTTKKEKESIDSISKVENKKVHFKAEAKNKEGIYII